MFPHDNENDVLINYTLARGTLHLYTSTLYTRSLIKGDIRFVDVHRGQPTPVMSFDTSVK